MTLRLRSMTGRRPGIRCWTKPLALRAVGMHQAAEGESTRKYVNGRSETR